MRHIVEFMQRYISNDNVSTKKLNTLPHVCNVAYVRDSVVNMQRESLADYVRRIRVQVKKISLTDVERNSGGDIDSSYVNRIENGLVTNVTTDKLDALARGLQVSADEIFAIARGISLSDPSVEEQRILSLYRALPLERRTDALSYLEMLFNRYGTEQPDQKNGKGPKPGAVYEAVAGIPKAINGGQKKARRSPRKKP